MLKTKRRPFTNLDVAYGQTWERCTDSKLFRVFRAGSLTVTLMAVSPGVGESNHQFDIKSEDLLRLYNLVPSLPKPASQVHLASLYDMVDPNDPQGRTWRQINAKLVHSIPVGALVELENGVRLFVVHHGRDCDMTPLYDLCYDPTQTNHEDIFTRMKWDMGYSEDSLTVIK